MMSDTMNEVMKHMSVNIHMKEFEHSDTAGSYTICIITSVDADLSFLEPKREVNTEKVIKSMEMDRCSIASNPLVHEQVDTASVTTSSTVTSVSEEKFAKEIKSGMKDKTVSRSVRTLQIMSILVGIILIVMTCKLCRNPQPSNTPSYTTA